MHVGRNNQRHVYKMKETDLKTTEEETDVGITMSTSLKPASQCRKAARMAQSVLSQIGRSFHFRDRHVFVRLYKQYVRPHLEFSTPAWSPWTVADKQILEDVQKRAVGMISGLRATTYEAKLVEIGIETLEERRHQADMAQTYKILHGKDRTATIFCLAAHNERATRSNADPFNLRIPLARGELRKNFYTHRVPAEWNKIPAELKNARTVQIFKRQYKAHRRTKLAAAA